jgi:hypothetical protein
MTMSNRGSRYSGEESPGREVGVGEFDLEVLRLTSLGGGESRSGQYTGTKALMLAILEDGIRSYLSPVGRVRNEAEYWVKSGRQRSPFCFTVVCETLGLEPDQFAPRWSVCARATSRRRALGRSPERAARRRLAAVAPADRSAVPGPMGRPSGRATVFDPVCLHNNRRLCGAVSQRCKIVRVTVSLTEADGSQKPFCGTPRRAAAALVCASPRGQRSAGNRVFSSRRTSTSAPVRRSLLPTSPPTVLVPTARVWPPSIPRTASSPRPALG